MAVDMRAAQQDDSDRSRYVIELAQGLRRRRVELVLITEPVGNGLAWGSCSASALVSTSSTHRSGSVREQLRWPRLLRETGCDVLLEPDHTATPWSSPVPVVTIMHGAVYEENAKLAPTYLTVVLTGLPLAFALRRARTVLTTSEATRIALNRHYNANIDRKNVIRPGAWNSQNAFPSSPPSAASSARRSATPAISDTSGRVSQQKRARRRCSLPLRE